MKRNNHDQFRGLHSQFWLDSGRENRKRRARRLILTGILLAIGIAVASRLADFSQEEPSVITNGNHK